MGPLVPNMFTNIVLEKKFQKPESWFYLWRSSLFAYQERLRVMAL